jgi:hypothetical protein
MTGYSFRTGIIIPVVLALLAVIFSVKGLQAAAPVIGQVEAVDGTNITIKITSTAGIQPGDRVELLYTTSTGVDLPVGTWSVRAVKGTTVTAEMADSSTRPVVGLRARIYPGSKAGERIAQPATPPVTLPERPQPLSPAGPPAAGWLGIAVFTDGKESPDGGTDMVTRFFGAKPAVRVVEVVAGGPADRAGLNMQDLIVELNGQSVREAAEFVRSIGGLDEGTEVKLTILRQGKRFIIPVVLGRAPER